MCMLHNDFSHVCSGKPARFSLIICGRFTVKLTVKLTKPHSCSAGASQTCDRSSAPQPMPTARRSAAELVSLTVSITRQRPEDLTAGEKKKAIRHAPTIWATMYERIRPYTTVYDRMRADMVCIGYLYHIRKARFSFSQAAFSPTLQSGTQNF